MRRILAIYGDRLLLLADNGSPAHAPAFSLFLFIYPPVVIPERRV